jgi:hypothetical protein
MAGKFLNQTERKTVETVFYQYSRLHTRLKPGVNEQVALVLLGQGKAQESPATNLSQISFFNSVFTAFSS